MKKGMLGVLVLLVAVGIALLGCGKASGGPSVSVPNTTVQMNTDNFVQTTRTIKAGQTLLFSDTVDGGNMHVICLGHDMRCDTQAQGPSALIESRIYKQCGWNERHSLTDRRNVSDYLHPSSRHEFDGHCSVMIPASFSFSSLPQGRYEPYSEESDDTGRIRRGKYSTHYYTTHPVIGLRRRGTVSNVAGATFHTVL